MRKIEYLLSESTPEQKDSAKKLTGLIDPEKIQKGVIPLMEKAESRGYRLTNMGEDGIYSSVLLPSTRVLKVLEQKETLDSISLEDSTEEIDNACVYFGLYLGCLPH